MGSPWRIGVAALGLLALLVLAGCVPSPARQVVGTWVVDEEQGMMGLLAKAGMKLEFSPDGKLTISGGPSGATVTQSGSWRFVEANGNSVLLETQFDGGQPLKLHVTLLDRDRIRLAPPSLPGSLELTFKRAA